ncbi:ParB/RepB/Spo0J family partition protein [Sandarakinorhabdus sp.]|uniref:ParB/RepB/Spo0J family partition protein n=1 Tax=Sandarakinorhabdus sp. TaxID=1916663 RepID=UPI00286EA17D|nr:ParB/RepB/Spo0J family partition protein [Sandarakinorhabdus sp.]
MADKKRISGLGRGLSALLDDVSSPPTPGAPGVGRVSIADIVASAVQPRRRFEQQAMDELVASVKLHGILQPILLRPLGDGRHEIVAGERRWRAAQAAGLHDMPAVVRSLDDREAHEISLIENIQRSDLNAIEEAHGYRRLIDEFGHTQQALADIVGKSRSHVTNLMRLLDLPVTVQTMVEDGLLAMGHARALVSAADPVALAQRAINEGLSVRAVEKLASGREKPKSAAARSLPTADANTDALELQLTDSIGMPVALLVAPGSSSGSLTIRFSTLDQLDWLCSRLNG